MDVRLPGGTGIEACREIRARLPGTHVVMLTSYPDEQAVVASVLAGASGYLLKDINPQGLRDALEIVARGGSLLSPDLVARVLAGVRRQAESEPGHDRMGRLTDQERRILTLIAEGKTNREIGELVCVECGMIISEERFAAAYVTKSGEARLFDDLGDMLVYEKKDDQEPVAYYVHDVRSRRWIPAEVAYYVRGDSVKSPMGWNIAAFESETEARDFAEKTGSQLLTWQELRAADLNMPHAHGGAKTN